MVALLAFLATAIATLFFESMLVRWTRRRRPHEGAWAVALALFSLAAAAFSVGASTGWDRGTFRAFYLLGAVVNVPWLAQGTLELLAPRAARRVRPVLLVFTGLALGVLLAAPMHGPIPSDHIPKGKVVFGVLPRVLAAVGSGMGALVVFAGAVWSVVRFLNGRDRQARRAGANVLIALGVVVLSAGGLLQGPLGSADEAFAVTLVTGISVIYAGFLVASGRTPPPATDDAAATPGDQASSRRNSLPASPRGNSSTTSIAEGHL